MDLKDYLEDYEYWCACAHETPTIKGFMEYILNLEEEGGEE